jgi:predicted O-methyltransferase YrrM
MRLPRLAYLYPSAVAYIAGLLAFGLFTARGRLRLAFLGYEAPWFRSPLPTLDLAEMTSSPAPLILHEVAVAAGNTSILEQIVLARLTESTQPKTLFEFGTFDGRTSLNLIAHAPADAGLYTLDLPAGDLEQTKFSVEPGEKDFIAKSVIGGRIGSSAYADRITQLYGDSGAFDFSPYFGTVDLVFVDASHAYDYVRCDTLTALKLLRPSGGTIAWHDYSRDWPGVIRALNEFYRNDSRFRNLRKIDGTTLVILRLG